VLPVCPCVVSFSKFHKPDTHDLLQSSRRHSRSILVRVGHARFPRNIFSDTLARMSRGCYEDATRKLLPWNFSLWLLARMSLRQRWYWCGHTASVQSTDPRDDVLFDEHGYFERTRRADAVVGIKIRELTKVRRLRHTTSYARRSYYAPVIRRWGHKTVLRSVRPSVCLSVCPVF